MIRRIIQIDAEKCNGCGLCVTACHEGAIGLVDGKAQLLRDDYCDGLGSCLPTCPTGAITFTEREAAAYDEAAVKARMAQKHTAAAAMPSGCPGMQAKALSHAAPAAMTEMPGQLSQWPVQIKLAPLSAPYFDRARLLIAADCTAYAYGSFHSRFIKDHITLIGCPKLDMTDYAEKLTQLFRQNDIREITVTRMEVPCCGGMEYAVQKAVEASGKAIPVTVVTISINGEILSRA